MDMSATLAWHLVSPPKAALGGWPKRQASGEHAARVGLFASAFDPYDACSCWRGPNKRRSPFTGNEGAKEIANRNCLRPHPLRAQPVASACRYGQIVDPHGNGPRMVRGSPHPHLHLHCGGKSPCPTSARSVLGPHSDSDDAAGLPIAEPYVQNRIRTPPYSPLLGDLEK